MAPHANMRVPGKKLAFPAGPLPPFRRERRLTLPATFPILDTAHPIRGAEIASGPIMVICDRTRVGLYQCVRPCGEMRCRSRAGAFPAIPGENAALLLYSHAAPKRAAGRRVSIWLRGKSSIGGGWEPGPREPAEKLTKLNSVPFSISWRHWPAFCGRRGPTQGAASSRPWQGERPSA